MCKIALEDGGQRMRDFDASKDSDVKHEIDSLLSQLNEICNEAPGARSYAATKLLKIPRRMRDFQHIIADLRSQLIKQEYFHLSEAPAITREQIKEVRQGHETLKQYELADNEKGYCLVDTETSQIIYQVQLYPRFIEKSKFWGWRVQFRHYKNPRLDIFLECDQSEPTGEPSSR